MRVCVVGLGKLGLPVAAVLAERHDVVGFDVDTSRVESVRSGRVGGAGEPGLSGRVGGAVRSGRLTVSSDPGCVAGCDVVAVLVPTPSGEGGTFDASLVVGAVRDVAGRADRPVTVVVLSTVSPGATRAEVIPAVEAHCPPGSMVAYSPLFVALGDVFRGLDAPDSILVGADDTDAHRAVVGLWAHVGGERHCVGIEDVEVAKLAVNTFLGVKVAWANHVAEVAARCGANSRLVLRAVGADRRIGPAFLSPGLPVTGPCLPRDLRAWQSVAGRGMVDGVVDENELVWRRVAGELCRAAGDGMPVLWGVGYKAGSSVSDDSPARVVGDLLGRPFWWVDVSGASIEKGWRVPPERGCVGAAHAVLTCEPAWRAVEFAGPVIDPWHHLDTTY